MNFNWIQITAALWVGGLLWTCIGCSRCDDIKSFESPSKPRKQVGAYVGYLDGYQINEPDAVIALPEELREASGLTQLSQTTVAMVQDELGTIYIYDIPLQRVRKRISFGPPGDYEGIARLGNTLYVLESNGHIYEVKNWSDTPAVNRWNMKLPTHDNEGLCYDARLKKLLIAPKSRWKSGKKKRYLLPVFSTSLEDGKLYPEPEWVLHTTDIFSFAVERKLDFPFEHSKHKKKPHVRFLPSSIAIHPFSGHIYMMSAVDNVLVEFDRSGKVRGFWQMARSLFPQPEGMTFLPDGTLVLASEAGAGAAQLYVFSGNRKDENRK